VLTPKQFEIVWTCLTKGWEWLGENALIVN